MALKGCTLRVDFPVPVLKDSGSKELEGFHPSPWVDESFDIMPGFVALVIQPQCKVLKNTVMVDEKDLEKSAVHGDILLILLCLLVSVVTWHFKG